MPELIFQRFYKKSKYKPNKQCLFTGLKVISFLLISCLLILPIASKASQERTGNSGNASNQAGNFELGGGFGTPSGINARYWITDKIGIDGCAGISLDKHPVFTMDLLLEEFQLYRTSTWGSGFFFGFGALFAKEGSDYKKNLRIPLGISLPLFRYPINFSFYVAPAAVISEKNKFEINWGIGIRYNFTRASAMKRRQENLEREVSRLGDNVENLQEGLNATKGKLAETEGKLSATKGKLSETEEKLNVTKVKLDELTEKLGTIKNRLDKTEGELDTTKTKLLLTTKELDNTKNQLDYVQNELKNTKRTLDDRQSELNKKQIELDQARSIIENAYTGKEKKEEEEKVALKQKELDEQLVQLRNQKKEWDKIKENEALRREQLKKKCEDRGGIIDENGYCTCPEHQEWDLKTDKCVCVKGYYRNKPSDDCRPCEIIRQNGACADGDCYENEDKVKLTSGPHKYVCVKKCRKNNEVWSKQKKTCVCKDGYYRNENGDCVTRQ